MLRGRAATILISVGVLGSVTACDDGNGDDLSSAERAALESLTDLGDPLPSPGNAVANDPAAAELGQALFWDPRLSQDQSISCSSCHQPNLGWSINEERSFGSTGPGGPDPDSEAATLSAWHSSTVVNLGYQTYAFWDGRADSLWAQAHGALTSPGVHRLTRLELARRVLDDHMGRYVTTFGEPPDLSDLPEEPTPEDQANLDDDQLQRVTTVTVNAAKAIEAYERLLQSRNSPFDKYMAGDEEAMSEEAIRGAKLFVDEERGCIECHSGPALSDGWFHNVGLPQTGDVTGVGALEGLPKVLASEFNGIGPWSDDPGAAQARLDDAQDALDNDPDALEGAFKTPGLRDVALRPMLGHTGVIQDLETWIRHYSTGGDGTGFPGNSEITPRDYTDEEVTDLVAFLQALTGEVPESLQGPVD